MSFLKSFWNSCLHNYTTSKWFFIEVKFFSQPQSWLIVENCRCNVLTAILCSGGAGYDTLLLSVLWRSRLIVNIEGAIINLSRLWCGHNLYIKLPMLNVSPGNGFSYFNKSKGMRGELKRVKLRANVILNFSRHLAMLDINSSSSREWHDTAPPIAIYIKGFKSNRAPKKRRPKLDLYSLWICSTCSFA